MEPDKQPGTQTSEQWVRLYDDFVNMEGHCTLLCELLTCLSRRELPLDAAGRHGMDLLSNRLREQLATFKQQLHKVRPD